jgi:hypothetical protein
MKLKVQNLSQATIEGAGILLSPQEGLSPGVGSEFSFELVCPELGMPSSLCAGRLECAARPGILAKLERHLKTPEILTATKGDSILCVAPAQEAREGRLAGLRALYVREGQSLMLDTGAWHWIPFPAGGVAQREGSGSTRFLVIFRAGTGDDDLGFCELAEKVEIEMEGEAR